ncbi:MAG: hypothetical protein FWF45_02555 [Coriobacteriia bacterium]|nr:hypothetical protein [Coriobacteriia bacterium]
MTRRADKTKLKSGEWTYTDAPFGWELKVHYAVPLIALLPQYAKRNAWLFVLSFLAFFSAFFIAAGMVTEWRTLPMLIAVPIVLIVTLALVGLSWPFRLLRVYNPETKRAYRLRSSEANRTETITLQNGSVTTRSISFPLAYLEKLDITPYDAYSGLFRLDGFDQTGKRWGLISWPGLPKSEIQAILAKISTSIWAPFKYELLEAIPENKATPLAFSSDSMPTRTSLPFQYGNEHQGPLWKYGMIAGVVIGGITPFLLAFIQVKVVGGSSSYWMIAVFLAYVAIGIGFSLVIMFSVQKLLLRFINYEGSAVFDDDSVSLTYQGRTITIPYKDVHETEVILAPRPVSQGGGYFCSVQAIKIATSDASYTIPVSLSENRRVNFARYGKKWRPRVLIDPEDVLFDQEYLRSLSLTQVLEEVEQRRGFSLYRKRNISFDQDA